MGQFYFEQLLGTALQGIDGYNITSTVLGVAGTILLLSFLYSVYQAFSMGGDVRMLAIGGIAYFILGLVFVNYGRCSVTFSQCSTRWRISFTAAWEWEISLITG